MDESGEVSGGCTLLQVCGVGSLSCACDASGCATPEPLEENWETVATLDAALDNEGDALAGTLRVGEPGGGGITIRLERQ